MPKVLHLIHSLNRGGIENWLISMVREVPRNKWQMDFCCKGANTGSLAELVQKLGAQVFHCPLGIGHLGFARELKHLLRAGKYDILHNHTETYSGFPVWVAQQLGIPTISSFHNTNFNPQTRFTRLPLVRELRSVYREISINYALAHSNLVTGCSKGVMQSLDPDGTRIKVPHRVLYYGVKLPELATCDERIDFRQSLGWTAETPLILHVGRLIEQKNHLGLLAVFQRVLEQIPTAKLLLVGEGPLRSVIEDAIAERSLNQSVLLLGLRDDVPLLMSKCDVFLFPSLYEGFGLVAIEANAARLPVVGSKIPGLTEAVKDGETAILKDIHDIEGMADAVIKLLSDRSFVQQMADAGLQWVQSNYSSQVSAENLQNMYKNLLQHE